MKQQRFRFKALALLLFALFVLLGLYGGTSVITYGNRWFSSGKNPRVRAQKQSVIAGKIIDRNGITLASTASDGSRVYQADKESRSAIVHLIGDSQGQVANSVESFQSGYLYGFQASLGELFMSAVTGQPRQGDDVTLTVDSQLCTQIVRSFGSHENSAGKNGAAVVMNYKTGEVLALVSLPVFDPDEITDETRSDVNKPFWDRAIQSVYTPGSTFKVITTASALENIAGIEDMQIICTGGLDVNGQAIRDYGSARHVKLSLKDAFAKSCNNAYALIALDLKDTKLRTTAESFGFNDNFLFRDLVVENSSYPTTNRTQFEVATSGFGQSAISATPMHMCMIAAAIANDGVMMEPRLLRKVTSATGKQRISYSEKVYRTACTADVARKIQTYMRSVVTSGTGTRAAVRNLTVCGKTGTAESSLNGASVNYAWFIGYSDSEELPFAVAVVVEDVDNGLGGGSVAAPIAADIFTWIRDHKERVTR